MENARKIFSKRNLIIAAAALILIILISLLFAGFGYIRSYSPDGEFMAKYNKVTKSLKIGEVDGERYWNISGYRSPDFLWSPSGSQLAISFTQGGRRTAEVMSIDFSSSRAIPGMAGIQRVCPESATVSEDEAGSRIEITKWLDERHIIVEFGWAADEPELYISGWLVYDISSFTIVTAFAEKTAVSVK